MVKIYIDSFILFKFQMLVVCNITNKHLVLFLFAPNNVTFVRTWGAQKQNKREQKTVCSNIFEFLKIINKVLKMICSALVILVKYVRI